MSEKGCNFASLFGSRGPRSELSGFFDALSIGRAAGRHEIIEMFAVRKSDKQVRDKEGIPRISGQDSEVTGERSRADGGAEPMRGVCYKRSGTGALCGLAEALSQQRKEDNKTIHNEEFDPGSG